MLQRPIALAAHLLEQLHRHVARGGVGAAAVHAPGVAADPADELLEGAVRLVGVHHEHVRAGVRLADVDEVAQAVVAELRVQAGNRARQQGRPCGSKGAATLERRLKEVSCV
jgi:hypothetical protein